MFNLSRFTLILVVWWTSGLGCRRVLGSNTAVPAVYLWESIHEQSPKPSLLHDDMCFHHDTLVMCACFVHYKYTTLPP